MSADYWLEWPDGDVCREHPDDDRGPVRAAWRLHEHSWNITYNVGPMLRAAGFPPWKDLKGAPCSEVAGPLTGVLDRLVADPATFQAMDPPNGWGNYEGARWFVRSLRDGCAAHPTAVLGASL